jgi:hypothetical protein
MAVRVAGQELFDALVRARVIQDPNDVCRVVIDIKAGEPAKVYVERYSEDNRLVDVIEAVGIEIRQAEPSLAA